MNESERLSRELSCTLTLHPSWEQLLKMAQYASDVHEPLQEFIIVAVDLRCHEIDEIRNGVKKLSQAFDEMESK